ncbi:MAG: bifunctional UDP-N-acetylglucosamine diphosphorylase/glucosamine-1-phosphate N-acetyltransferase GlmU [Erysipelotrichaceae bacterium]|nr:bifunctional UDP-N-acetylglucosamine diphosphorylase/glucosamine-1-phosphate N-acetyltransferase GlmU [Erysipelotrichaceae bacterium]
MKTYAVVLAAGKGTRMKSDKPKVVHEVLYKPMINLVVDELKRLGVDETIVVVGHGAEQVEALLDDSVTVVYQREQKGTGHAVLMAKDILAGKEGTTIVLNGDAPLIRAETLQGLVDYHNAANNKGTVMSCDCDLSLAFGRIIKKDGQMTAIVEYKDLKDDMRDITEMNVGEYCFDNVALFDALSKVTNNNAQGEYYITDVLGILHDEGQRIDAYKIPDLSEVGGINDRLALAESTKILQKRINSKWLLEGVTIIDMDNTYISPDVVIGQDTVIEPGCILKGQTVIGNNCHIGPYCEFTNVTVKDNVEIKYSVISDSVIESGTDIGPFARLRTDCHIMNNVHIGNFVEMKKAHFGNGSKSAHLTYIGDAEVGDNVNIGCGTITSNYDGKNKSMTIIGDDAFIGCNSNLVAPVNIGKGAFIAAGSTVTDDVEDDAFGIARAKQINKPGYAKVLEEKRMKIYEERRKK